jgi:hypothetical protein
MAAAAALGHAGLRVPLPLPEGTPDLGERELSHTLTFWSRRHFL